MPRGFAARNDDAGQAGLGKQPPIARGVGPAPFRPARQVAKLHAQHRSLDRVDAEVAAHQLVEVLGFHPVVPQQPHLVRQSVVIGRDETRVAETAKVLAREERETAKVAKAADLAAMIRGADGLCRVLDDLQIVLVGERDDGAHIGGLAKQVDRHQHLGPRRARARRRAGIRRSG